MPQPATPDPSFRWEDDDQTPGVSIRPLGTADLRAFLTEWDDDDDQPLRLPPAARPAAMHGLAAASRPGGSAHAEYQRRRGEELTAWTATLATGVTVGLAAGSQLGARLGVVAALAGVGAVGWRLRFRPTAEARAWQRGATGEQRTATLLARLERQGWTVLHDLAVPGSRANTGRWRISDQD